MAGLLPWLLGQLFLFPSIQLCRLSEDLAAFPDAAGRHPHRGPRHQPAVTRPESLEVAWMAAMT